MKTPTYLLYIRRKCTNYSSKLLNGSEIQISETSAIRFRTIETGLPSPIQTETYFIEENHSLPVISITTNPRFLWSDSEGIILWVPTVLAVMDMKSKLESRLGNTNWIRIL